ncbi:MAG: 4-hydroxybutyrate CoA-transferase, partial [Cryomorphaceae bacterium]
MRRVSAEEAMQCLKTGDNIYVHSVAAVPVALIKAMTERGKQLNGVNIYHLHTEGDAPYAARELATKFHIHALFVGANVRQAVNEGRASYIPVFLSEMPILFREMHIKLNVALISVSPPDQ